MKFVGKIFRFSRENSEDSDKFGLVANWPRSQRACMKSYANSDTNSHLPISSDSGHVCFIYKAMAIIARLALTPQEMAVNILGYVFIKYTQSNILKKVACVIRSSAIIKCNM